MAGIIAVSVVLVAALLASGCGSGAASGSASAQGGSSRASSGAQASSSQAASDAHAALSSWTEGSNSLKALTEFVDAATDESGSGYIPPEDRVAVFDLDGTLMCETYPWCFEYMVFADNALNNPDYEAPEEIAAVAQEIVDSAWGKKPDGMSTRQAQAAAIAYEGLTPAQLEAYVTEFKKSQAEGFSGMTSCLTSSKRS